MYVQRQLIHCCRGKGISITYSECVSVALVIQHSKRMPGVFLCGLPGITTVFHIISQTARFL